MKKKALSWLLCAALILTMIPAGAVTAWADTTNKPAAAAEVNASPITTEAAEKTAAVTTSALTTIDLSNATGPAISNTGKEPVLAYVPLDNRPVNVDRVIYEAESAGFQVIMPEEDLCATRLDGQPLNSNGTPYGDSKKLMAWIEEMDQKTDYFVISLDQLLSGGLVNSRTLYGGSYSDEYQMIDKLVELSQNNQVYIVDTVARLATCTVGYQGADLNTYNAMRQYNLQGRYVLKSRDLTVKNIIADYTKSEKGGKLANNSVYAKEINHSLKTRERKLKLIDYLLSMDGAGRMKYFIGIDDSNPQNTIQTNEVNYLKKKLDGRGLIYSGADELGMMAVLNLMIDYYGYNVNASATYFGNTESSGSGSVYDMETVKENLEKHLESIGINLVDRKKADIEIVVLTSPSTAILNSKYIDQAIDYINGNISKGIPTIVINSAPSAYSGNLEYRMTRECEMSMLLAYSSWGTVGNSIGLALCNGVSRYLYLHSRDNSSDTADIAFLKGLIFSYEKDISYIRGGGKTLFNDYLTSNGWSTSNFYQSDEQVKTVNAALENMLKTSEYNVTVGDIVDNLTGCRYFKGLDGECGIIGKINLSNYSAPFFRTYEIHFDIGVKLSDITLKGVKDALTVDLPYIPAAGELTYSYDLYYMDQNGKLQKLPVIYNKQTGQVTFATNAMPNFFTAVLTMDADKAASLFVDVHLSAWYFDYVMYAYEKGLMSGTSSNTFQPSSPMTRGMMVYALYQMAGEPTAKNTALPADVKGWYEPAAAWALEKGISSVNSQGLFGAGEALTREELAHMLWQYGKIAGLDMEGGSSTGVYGYADVFAVEPELREAMDWTCRTGILTGTSGGTLLAPKSTATRAEVAAMLKRLSLLQ
ncbi:DUF4127 family protein [Aminipila butyrica]|uniref:DUF4127 family protein n=1 Tax=Aminipila butyrica TaxID=433296 RepID=A0A858C149_9FIRM|nr:DUF4127 family protein [Aminipila butyrica]QIB70166.1 DUF4127 family protein [Aminipila butyrica]